MVPNAKISFSILSEERTERLVFIPSVLVGVSLEVEVTFLMRRILEACRWRLTTYGEGCATSSRERLLQVLILLLMMIEMAATDPGQGPLPISLFRMMRITIISVEVRVHPVKV